jgi:hypothetical protein
MYMSHFSTSELIFHKVGNEIISAGFGVNSILLSKGLSPILTFTSNFSNEEDESSSSDDENVSNSVIKQTKQVFKSFKNLAVPIGLFTTKTPNIHSDIPKEYSHIKDDIYEELIKLSTFKNKPQSKKNNNNKKTKTKTYKHNK